MFHVVVSLNSCLDDSLGSALVHCVLLQVVLRCRVEAEQEDTNTAQLADTLEPITEEISPIEQQVRTVITIDIHCC